MGWIPLHVHSQYSILDSTASVKALTEKAKSYKLSALALTDFGNMYGGIDFFKSCLAADIKPIIGIEIAVAPFSRHDKKRISNHSVGYPLILLAKGHKGYQNLCKISSIASLEGFYYTPRVDKEILKQYADDLICLSGPIQSRLSQMIIQDREDEFQKELSELLSLYKDDFYLEMQRHQMTKEAISQNGIDHESWLYQSYVDLVKNQDKVINTFRSLSKEKGIPFVATNDIHYLEPEDWKAHEILMNVQSGEPCEIVKRDSYGHVKGRSPNPKRKVITTHELYFKSPQQMEDLFADMPEAIQNSEKIAQQCNLTLDLKAKYYPVFTPPHLEGQKISEKERIKEAETFLRNLCEKSIATRYTSERLAKVQEIYPKQNPIDVVQKRLNHELEIITSKGMCDYLLIVYDFIAWAKKQNIPVGPGRGSGAGSIILYLIGITDIEPLRFHLFFERFINPERMSYPDIDVDICMDRRSEVIDYTLKKYGKDKVAQIITFGTMKTKMAIKDVGRVLSVPLAKVNAIAKLIPEDLNMTLEKALSIDPELKAMAENDEETNRILELAQKLEGSIRNTGIHAAGLIICGDPLTDHIPICLTKGSDIAVTQYSMKPVEAVGMLKIDFLGLKTLTSIQKTVDSIENSTEKKINWVDLPLDDQNTFNLLNQGKTQGVFQLESSGMQELAKQLHIDKFEEIIAVGALYRPGPMEMIPSFVNRKHGREAIEVDHPMMEEIIKETYGIMVYQEQVMQIAQKLAGYSLGEGDVLRRAMGKKDRREMASQREKFEEGAKKQGIEQKKAIEIFDKIEKFASYGFNKSHAAAYGYLSYVTAFLKANYPKEWLASLMTCDRDDLSKVSKHIREAKAMEIEILSPDINEADLEFTASPKGIRFAMSGIKGVGSGVVASIIKERKENGPFDSLYDFFKRIDTKTVGKKVTANLIEAGSFDFTGWTREELLVSVEPMFEHAARKQKEDAKGILDLFATIGEDQTFDNPPNIPSSMTKDAILTKEKELLGFYLTGHPMDAYKKQIEELHAKPFHEIDKLPHGSICKTTFIIESLKTRISTKTQRKFAILTISDGMERLELPIWPDLYEEKGALLHENRLLIAILQIDRENDTLRLRCHTLEDLSSFDANQLTNLNALFDQANEMAKSEMKKKKKKQNQMSPQQKEQKLEMSLDADKTRFSHIVTLKKIFNKFSGSAQVQITFQAAEKKIGTLEIESKQGVKLTSELKNELETFSFIQSFSFEE